MDAAVAALLARDDAANDGGSDDGSQGGSPPPNPDTPRKFKVTVDGEDREVEEAELLSGYSFRARNTQVAQKLAEDRKAFESKDREVTEKLERLTKALPEIEKLAEADVARYADVDWAALKKENPAEYASLRADYDIDRERLQTVQAERKRTEDELSERRETEFRSFAERQYETLLEKRPEWKDEKVRTKDMQAIAEYATTVGYTADEVAGIYDHRAYLLLDKALRYDALMERVNAAKNGGGRPKPKPAAPSGRTTPPGSGSERERTALGRLSKSGRMEDAVAALLARGK